MTFKKVFREQLFYGPYKKTQSQSIEDRILIIFSFLIYRIGVNGFENPMRDPKTEEFKNQIGQGCKVKMDETGNILIKRFSKATVSNVSFLTPIFHA